MLILPTLQTITQKMLIIPQGANHSLITSKPLLATMLWQCLEKVTKEANREGSPIECPPNSPSTYQNIVGSIPMFEPNNPIMSGAPK